MSAATPDLLSIAAQLKPFLRGRELSSQQLEQVHNYLDLLLRWNARINLTALREPGEIVTRHFGESFFLASTIMDTTPAHDVVDVGSGAGFPGVPLKIFAPAVQVTLVESNNKKATFLKEVIRALTLTGINVFGGRAQDFAGEADLVTMRAVEKFEQALPAAAALVRRQGRLAMLVGSSQTGRAQELLKGFKWESPVAVPQSRERVLMVGVNS
ncbi:MAG: 16S rRNA (guanine(527)-N(7))-methyltransferase RsmG [Acidobacteriales bacterium]|nr:16S rRNA (guanine(527)-N(7))-methyltransferase RsmG [Terriglobales bacterium]